MCTFGLSGCRVKTWRKWSRRDRKSEILGAAEGGPAATTQHRFWLKSFWLKPFHAQDGHCFRVVRQCVLFDSFCTPVRRCSIMPRRGWSTADVPGGWIQILRGPKPRSEQWPRAGARSPMPNSVQVAQLRKLTFKSTKDKVNPWLRRGCSGEGSRSVERFPRPIYRCSEV